MKLFHARSLTRWALLAAAFGVGLLGSGAAAWAAPVTVSDAPAPAPQFNGPIRAMATLYNVVYVGGDFTTAQWHGKTVNRHGLAAIDQITGALLPWAPSVHGSVHAIATDPQTDSVYIGGVFDRVNGVPRDSLAHLDGDEGVLGQLSHSIDGDVLALALGDGRLYVGGTVTRVDTTNRAGTAAFSLTTFDLDPTWAPRADAAVEAVALDPGTGRVYLGGRFTHVNGAPVRYMTAVNAVTGVVDSSFAVSSPYRVRAITIGGAKVFGAVDGPGGVVIGWGLDGSAKWYRVFDADPQALGVLDGVLYVGGGFNSACTSGSGAGLHCSTRYVPRTKLAALDPRSGALLAWNPHPAGIVAAQAITTDPKFRVLFVGGRFSYTGAEPLLRFPLPS